ncbi:hypothetical protein HYALB_00006461 [Hymenoscyphus albidus]|uniref:Uncharacterized protein n=1 Tax=Hymenoscyphus albidus TaxID=595503 RepID=A0A9N9LHX4_9HELO|nr:hypothetical protein HYALB_00006461 [Hymenoscyphus albidus]
MLPECEAEAWVHSVFHSSCIPFSLLCSQKPTLPSPMASAYDASHEAPLADIYGQHSPVTIAVTIPLRTLELLKPACIPFDPSMRAAFNVSRPGETTERFQRGHVAVICPSISPSSCTTVGCDLRAQQVASVILNPARFRNCNS